MSFLLCAEFLSDLSLYCRSNIFEVVGSLTSSLKVEASLSSSLEIGVSILRISKGGVFLASILKVGVSSLREWQVNGSRCQDAG